MELSLQTFKMMPLTFLKGTEELSSTLFGAWPREVNMEKPTLEICAGKLRFSCDIVLISEPAALFILDARELRIQFENELLQLRISIMAEASISICFGFESSLCLLSSWTGFSIIILLCPLLSSLPPPPAPPSAPFEGYTLLVNHLKSFVES